MKHRDDGHQTRERIREFIRAFRKTRGYSPTIREIGAGVGGLRPSVVAYHLNRLQEEGEIKRSPRQPRTVTVVSEEDPPTRSAAGKTIKETA